MQGKLGDKAGYKGKKDKGFTMIFSNINNLIITTNYNTMLNIKNKVTFISTLHASANPIFSGGGCTFEGPSFHKRA